MQIEFFGPDDLDRLRASPGFADIGAYLEHAVVSILAPFAPPAFLWPQPIVPAAASTGEIELTDVLFWHDRTCVLFECKARKLRAQSEAYDVTRVTRWLDRTLGHATRQVDRAIRRLRTAAVLHGRSGRTEVLADLGAVTEYIPAIIVFEVTDFFWNPEILARKAKCPHIQLFDLRGLFLAAKFLPELPVFLRYLAAKQTLSTRHPAFLPYEDNLLLFFLAHRFSLAPLIECASTQQLTLAFASGLPSSVRSTSLFANSIADVYASLGITDLAT